MFLKDRELRLPLFKKIYSNLTRSNTEDLSRLRRLEIRYLGLDPTLCKYIFNALKTNFVLQELILTDDCLQHCSLGILNELWSAIENNKHCALTLLDLSRNYHAFDNNESAQNALL